MKKVIFTIMLIGFLILAISLTDSETAWALNFPHTAGMPSPLATVQQRAKLVDSVTSDDSALGTTDSSWTDCAALFIEIPAEWNVLSLSFYGYGDGDGAGDPNDATFSFDVYVCDYFGGAEMLSSGNSGVFGAQQMSHNPYTGAELNSGAVSTSYCWADTITEGTTYWSTAIYYTDYEGNDRRAKLKFDRHEAYGLWVRIYDMTAQSVTSVTCVANGF